MSRFFKIVFYSFFIIINFNNNLSAQKNAQNKKTEGHYHINFSGVTFYRQLLENMVHNHPVLSSVIASTLVGYGLYSDEIHTAIKNNRELILGCSIPSIFFASWQREAILGVPEDEEDDVEVTNMYQKFVQSGVRIYYAGDIDVTFKDVAGLESAKEDLDEIKKFLENPEAFEQMGAKIPKGILLNGEPGNGKTLLARALAGEVNCPFLYIAATEFIEAIGGTGAGRVRHLFQTAKDLAPCIIFIDEIDAIGGKRSTSRSGLDSEYTQTINQFLAEMDGFEQNENPIVVIAATNRASVLDEALVRPGRFDRKIQINKPFFKDRCQVIKIYLDKVKSDSSINVEKIALGTIGFSAADLAQLINEAAILAVRQGSDCVTMQHIDQARDYVVLGRETKGMNISKDELWVTAVHEAGHALMYVYQSNADSLYKVSVVPRGPALGIAYGMPVKEQYSKTEAEMKAAISVVLGGSVAEEMIFGHRAAGASNDLEKARVIATHMVMAYGMTQEFKDVSFLEFIDAQFHLPDQVSTKLHKAVAEVILECRKDTEKILHEHKDVLLKLADMLIQKGTVFGSEVYEMCGIKDPGLIYSLA